MHVAKRVFAALLLFVVLPTVWAETIVGKVVAIADGDTITILRDETPVKVRLHGIDTPEKAQDFGTAAKSYTGDLCFRDVVTVVVTDTDRYGRKVGLVVLKDGRVLNHELVAAGLAHWYADYAPHDETLRRLQEQAMAAKRGLWSRPDAITPQDFRQGKGKRGSGAYNPPGVTDRDFSPTSDGREPASDGTVYVTNSGTKFHRSTCRFLKDSRRSITRSNAERSYEACGICRP